MPFHATLPFSVRRTLNLGVSPTQLFRLRIPSLSELPRSSIPVHHRVAAARLNDAAPSTAIEEVDNWWRDWEANQ